MTQEGDEGLNRPVTVVGSVGSEGGQGRDGRGRAVGGEMPHGFDCFTTQSAQGEVPRDGPLVERVVAQIRKGGDELNESVDRGAGVFENFVGFPQVQCGEP